MRVHRKDLGSVAYTVWRANDCSQVSRPWFLACLTASTTRALCEVCGEEL